MNEQITGALFKDMILFAAASLTQHQQSINDLNVFPVPDGDTGTNMSLTMQAAANELRKCAPKTLEQAASVTASALLRGARGNSGVILSLLFQGISRGFKGCAAADARTLAAAMQEGVTKAYGAVMNPTEGTILTVSRLASERAGRAAEQRNRVDYVLEQAIEQGEATLAETVNMNPVLKKAGVVDAGGKGYLVVLGAMLSALRGEPLPEVQAGETKEHADFAALGEEDITFTFDTVFIVRRTSDRSIEPLRAYLASIGDSLVIGEDDTAFKVHVHTDIPGEALSEAQKYGTLELAKIENMRTQAADLAAGRKAQSTDDLDEPDEEPLPRKRFGYLTVCAGDGLAAVFRDLGADEIISGGQTMNPSTESILAGIEKIPADTVFVLPNNKNIVMAAQQCVELCRDKEVIVVPTATVPQGISAMMAVDPDESDAQSIVSAMQDAASGVTTGQITYAARDSEFDGFHIEEGDYLALLGGKLFGTARELDALLGKLADEAAGQNADFISLFYGEDVSEDEAKAAAELFSARCPAAEVNLIPGGQPVYYYIVAIE